MVQCSVCQVYGHNKRNTKCPARMLTQQTIRPYIKPVILWNQNTGQYYSIVEHHIPPQVISNLISQDIIRWAFYSHQTNLYRVFDKEYKPSNNLSAEEGILKLAFLISKPTLAVINFKAWDILYTPIVSSQSKECSICYESLPATHFITTNCAHSFCFSCIQGCIHSAKSTDNLFNCPMCRTLLTQVNVYDINIHNTLSTILYQL